MDTNSNANITSKDNIMHHKKDDVIQQTDPAVTVTRSIPKLEPTLQVNVVDFYRMSFEDDDSLSYIKRKLFPDLNHVIRDRIWSCLHIAQDCFSNFQRHILLPLFYKSTCCQFTKNVELFYADIHILQKCNFEDENLILGRLFLAKAIIQRLKIREARAKMCDIALLTRIQRYKIRKSLPSTINAIRWWLTPEAEEAFKESMATAASYLEPTLLTHEHLFLIQMYLLDAWIIMRFVNRAIIFNQSTCATQQEVELIRQHYLDMCCCIIVSNTYGIIPFAFYEDVNGYMFTKSATHCNNIKQNTIEALQDCYVYMSRNVRVTQSMHTSLNFEGNPLTTHLQRTQENLLLVKTVAEFAYSDRFRSLARLIESSTDNQSFFDQFAEMLNLSALSAWNRVGHLFLQDTTSSVSEFLEMHNEVKWSVALPVRDKLQSCENDDPLEIEHIWKNLQCPSIDWLPNDQNTDDASKPVSSNAESQSENEQPKGSKKVLKKRRRQKTVNATANESASESDDDISLDSDCEGGPLWDATDDSTTCVYFRHQV